MDWIESNKNIYQNKAPLSLHLKPFKYYTLFAGPMQQELGLGGILGFYAISLLAANKITSVMERSDLFFFHFCFNIIFYQKHMRIPIGFALLIQ
jgi:hypothetical protein